jgi:hypothetical protein
MSLTVFCIFPFWKGNRNLKIIFFVEIIIVGATHHLMAMYGYLLRAFVIFFWEPRDSNQPQLEKTVIPDPVEP